MKANNINESVNAKQEQLKGFISGIKVLSTKYNITQDEVLAAATEAIAKGYKYEYFMEPKIEVQINNQNLKIIVYQKVVETKDEVEHDGFILLKDALKIQPGCQVGDYIIMKNPPDVEFTSWSRKTINIFNQILIQRCKEISRQNIIKTYSSKVGTLVKGVVEGLNHSGSGYIVRLFDNNAAFLPKYLCSPKDNIKVSLNNHVKFLIHSVISNESKFSDYSIVLSRNSDKFVIELFNEVIPEIKDNLITIICGARVAGIRTKIIAQSHNQYIHVIGAFIGQNEERINIIRKEIDNERIEIIQFVEDKLELLKKIINHVEPIYLAEGDLFNEKTQTSSRAKFIVVNDLELGKAVGPRWINVELLKRIFNENWTVITATDATNKKLNQFRFNDSGTESNHLKDKNYYNSKKAGLDISKNASDEKETSIIKNLDDKNNDNDLSKVKKINFKDLELKSTSKENKISLEAQLEMTKPLNKKANTNYSKPKLPNKKNSYKEDLDKQNEILKQKWAQENINLKQIDEEYDDDFDENIDLNDDFDDLYD